MKSFHVEMAQESSDRRLQWKCSAAVAWSSCWLVCSQKLFSITFKSRENHVSCRALQSYNSPGDWARNLFKKPSADSASLVVEIEKNFFSFSVGVFRGGTLQVEVFLATFTWPWAPTHWAIIMAQDFFGN